ncbi:hypothetical protein DUNSADRAFT_3418 [Dunaliella salina]|uniref:Encoded protein n=1 Tax=Dunaliella salina TaxID=3046 RepID=A0ABQ7GU15_DUNSA|nr:hypothetical protein DUNSADRAFT_3418 [Dunaliella salina]|eukprot:KAF5838109.1 hypothetical protein DUNSADRAFT_3418 [Dunaliella salina]
MGLLGGGLSSSPRRSWHCSFLNIVQLSEWRGRHGVQGRCCRRGCDICWFALKVAGALSGDEQDWDGGIGVHMARHAAILSQGTWMIVKARLEGGGCSNLRNFLGPYKQAGWRCSHITG